MRVLSTVRRASASPALYTAVLYAFLGVGFAGANLLLAYALPAVDYATITLIVALLNLGVPLSVVGLDGLIIRGRADLGPRLLGATLLAATIVGTIVAAIAHFVYRLDVVFLAMLLPAIVAGGASYLVATKFQSLHRFTLSVSISQVSNISLLLAALIIAIVGVRQVWLPLLVILVGSVMAAVWGWTRLLTSDAHRSLDHPRGEALFYVAVSAANLLLGQMERLLTPKLLTLEDLAVFGVVAAVVIAPFRSLQMAIGHTLPPHLRAAGTLGARRRVVAREAALVGMLVLAMAVVIWYLAPALIGWFLGARYPITPAILLAAIVAGAVKVGSTAAQASVTALGDRRELGYLSILSWVAVAGALAGAAVGARWGLSGVIYGATFGWAVQGFAAAGLAAPHLRRLRSASPRPGDLADP